MNVSCEIINDLLPLYVEGLASEDSCHLIEEHMNSCSSCKEQYERMKKPQKLSPPNSTVPLKKLRKHLFKRKVETILLVTALVFSFMVTLFAYLTSPNYIPYSKSVVSCISNTDENISVKFRNDVTRYNIYYFTDDKGNKCADIQAWDTPLDSFFPYTDAKSSLITSVPGSVRYIWYCSSNETEDTLIYGEDNHDLGEFITLPRLVLGYYAIFAFVLTIIGVIILRLFRENNKVKDVAIKIVLLPFSYFIGHICVKGFNHRSYSPMRDFSLILLVAILVYCVLLSAQSLYKIILQNRE